MRNGNYYAVDWHPLLVAVPYIAGALVLAAVVALTLRARRWANRPRVYDWQQDPCAVEDLAPPTERDRDIAEKWAVFATAREACRDERRARLSLYEPGFADVLAFPAATKSSEVVGSASLLTHPRDVGGRHEYDTR